MSGHKSPVTLTQIAASALAASSAAFAASSLGVTGTIIGAAVASVIATVASAMYGASLDRSAAAVRRTTSQLVRSPGPRAAGPLDPGTPTVGPVRRSGDRWTRTVLAAVAVLGITLGTVTGVESILGRPLSALLGDSGTGTTLGSAVSAEPDGGQHQPAGEPTNLTPDPAGTPTPEPTPTDAPTDPPTTTPVDPTEPTDPTEQADPTEQTEPSPAPTPSDAPTGTAEPTPADPAG